MELNNYAVFWKENGGSLDPILEERAENILQSAMIDNAHRAEYIQELYILLDDLDRYVLAHVFSTRLTNAAYSATGHTWNHLVIRRSIDNDRMEGSNQQDIQHFWGRKMTALTD